MRSTFFLFSCSALAFVACGSSPSSDVGGNLVPSAQGTGTSDASANTPMQGDAGASEGGVASENSGPSKSPIEAGSIEDAGPKPVAAVPTWAGTIATVDMVSPSNCRLDSDTDLLLECAFADPLHLVPPTPPRTGLFRTDVHFEKTGRCGGLVPGRAEVTAPDAAKLPVDFNSLRGNASIVRGDGGPLSEVDVRWLTARFQDFSPTCTVKLIVEFNIPTTVPDAAP